MTLYDVSSAIRSFGGEIWLIKAEEFGVVFRVRINRQQCRIVKPPIIKTVAVVPTEGNSLTLIVGSIEQLNGWLKDLTAPAGQKEGGER